MAAGEAKKLHKRTGKTVVIVDRLNRVQWCDLYAGVPYILDRHRPGSVRMLNAGGSRPYIVAKTPEKWVWKPYQPRPAPIVFTADELAQAEPFRGCVMVEPNIKPQSHDNKAWIWSRWVSLLEQMPGVRFVQCLPGGTRPLDGCDCYAVTNNFRQALAVLSVCRAFVGTEGALHHGAAAVGTPAVVLFSEFISPASTGYPNHHNLRHAGAACGSRKPCKTCAESMRAISVLEVVAHLEEILQCQEKTLTPPLASTS